MIGASLESWYSRTVGVVVKGVDDVRDVWREEGG